MSPEATFELASSAALVAWASLAASVWLPAGVGQRVLAWAAGRAIPFSLCAVYVALLVVHWGSAPGGGYGSLEAVAQLGSSRGKVLGGWVHHLAFDLLIGRWIVDDVSRRALSRWWTMPVLGLTLMFGPAGLLLHLALRPRGALPVGLTPTATNGDRDPM